MADNGERRVEFVAYRYRVRIDDQDAGGLGLGIIDGKVSWLASPALAHRLAMPSASWDTIQEAQAAIEAHVEVQP